MTDRELGHGSYATVQELEYMGLKCAGKKIHDLLLRQGDASYTLRRFEEECRLLSQARHPNIVQFLGVHFQRGVRVPILVMEYLPTNLTSCIEQYYILPKEIGYSILDDVALGLYYLHSQTPPIIHRDLSSNNVLLTANMTGKISDLGVARIFNKLTPLQVSQLTNTPGTPAFMPPEVMVANPKYDTSVDEFSYGILMIHMFSGRWPEPQVGQTRIEGGQLIPVTEAERREVFLRAIGNEHPLMDLILRLINNDPQVRPHASEIVERLAAMVLQFPASFANRLEMLRHIQHQEEEKRVLREERETERQAMREEREAENRQNQQEMTRLREEAQEKAEEVDRLNLSHSSEVEELKLQVRDLNSQNEQLKVEREAESKEMNSKVAFYEDQIQNKEKAMKQEREEYTSQLAKERSVSEMQITDLEMKNRKQREEYEARIANQREDYEAQLTSERESNRRLSNEISQSKTSTNSLQEKVSSLEAESSRKDATIERKETELESKSRALEEKDSIISGMRQQLTRTREHLTAKQQVGISNILIMHEASMWFALLYVCDIVCTKFLSTC